MTLLESVNAFLESLEDVNPVRATAARRIASELDKDELPAYVVAKLSCELRAIIDQIENVPYQDAETPTEAAHRLLREVSL